MSLPELTENFLQQLARYGPIGVFLMSLLGASSILVPIPYTTVIVFLGASGWDPILLMVSAGAGAALGEFTGYMLGYYGRKILSEERQRKMEFTMKLFGRYKPVAIFLFALTPLPDDLLFIPLGISRYNIVKAFVPALLGKMFMIYLLAYTGGLITDTVSIVFGTEGTAMGMIFTTLLSVLALVALFRIDWERVFEKYVAKRRGSRD